MALRQHRTHHTGMAAAGRSSMNGLGGVAFNVCRLAARLAYPGAASADAHHQWRAQRGAQTIAQLMHEIVKTAADGHLAVVDRSAQALGQRHGFLTVAGPDWARKHQIFEHVVIDQAQRIGGVDDQRVIALGGIGAGLQQESVHAGGCVVHQRVAADGPRP